MHFEEAFTELMKIEGGYVNDLDDYGGETKYGITKRTARLAGYSGKMNDLTIEIAKEIYFKEFWKPYNYHLIENRLIAIEMLDQAVHFGPTLANKHLQQTLNQFGKEIKIDGIVGPVTIENLNSFSQPYDLLLWINSLQFERYMLIIKKDFSQWKYFRGWLKRVIPKVVRTCGLKLVKS